MRRINTERLHIEKKIPVTIFITLFCQIAMALVWATHLEARVAQTEARTQNMEAISERLARLEERLDGVRQELGVVSRQTDKIFEKVAGR